MMTRWMMLFGLLVPAAAGAQTVTFDDLAFDGGAGTPAHTANSVTSGGFLFTGPGGNATPDFVVYARNDPRNADPGGAALGMDEINLTYTMTRSGGGAFDFAGFDVSQLNNDASGGGYTGVLQVFFDGVSAGFFSFDGTPGYQFVNFTGSGIHTLGIRTDNYIAIDNLLVSTNAGVVPESASWAMMIVGFGLVGAASRRRRAARPALRSSV